MFSYRTILLGLATCYGGIALWLTAARVPAAFILLALFLAFLAFPASRRSPRDRIPLADWALALVAGFCGAYLLLLLLVCCCLSRQE